jgi:hypothetical protein
MNRFVCVVALVCAGATAGCADKDTVLFVTNSSLGINFDSKPPTANIAYDRTEGFIGPRFPNGGTPPAVASIETGGTIFDPKVRQVYATGHAAVRATKGKDSPEGPEALEGDANQKKLMFFGTETTVGLKVGFGTNGTPDSLLFGYRRKEASIIPLGQETEVKDGKTVTKAVYPSVLASIDMNTHGRNLPETGLTTKQFFATGQAAVAMATNPNIAAAFAAKAESAALAGLSKTERDTVEAKVAAAFKSRDQKFNTIIECVGTPNGGIDKEKLGRLVAEANKNQGAPVLPADVANQTTQQDLKRRLGPPVFVNALYDGLPRDQTTGEVRCPAN